MFVTLANVKDAPWRTGIYFTLIINKLRDVRHDGHDSRIWVFCRNLI